MIVNHATNRNFLFRESFYHATPKKSEISNEHPIYDSYAANL